MKTNKVTENFHVATQVSLIDLPQLKVLGFKSIICNRPDGEVAEQPLYADIEKQAIHQGMQCEYLPVANTNVSEQEISAFKQLIDSLPKPILAYCRTGTRSITLWSYSQASEIEPSEILLKTKNAGYDMTAVVDKLLTL